MKSRATRKKGILSTLILSVLLSGAVAASSPLICHAEGPLRQLLPREADLTGWRLDGEPQTAEGVRLFELINGGAEEYLKEGFRRAVIATYRNSEGKRINLDIYEMLSPEAARNIYRKKAGDKGQRVSVGEEAALEDYYLNFRKGPFAVALSGYDAERATREFLIVVARLVAERIGAFLK